MYEKEIELGRIPGGGMQSGVALSFPQKKDLDITPPELEKKEGKKKRGGARHSPFLQNWSK